MREMFMEVQSKFDFEQTVRLLSEKIELSGWKLLAVHNLQQSLANNGYDVQPVKVLELCNPHHAVKILSRDDERVFSNLMPCRISVYVKKDEGTYVSLMNAGMLAAQIGGVVEEVMTTVFNDTKDFLKAIAE